MSNCGCCISVETPDSIMSDDNIDVFTIIISSAYGASVQKARDILWQRYRYRMIGSCDRNVWLQCMKDRADYLSSRYVKIFAAYDNADFTKLEDGSYTLTTESKSEDLPQTTADTTEYLSNRGRVTQSYVPTELAPYEAVDKFGRELRNPYEDFVGEFESLFLMVPS